MTKTLKLNQALAAEAQQKGRIEEGRKWIKGGIRSMVMDGALQTYTPLEEGGEQLPPDEKLVQDSCAGVFRELVGYFTPFIDATATKDYGNVVAKADVVMGGMTLLKDAPVPFLLFVEKTLTEWRGFINGMPQRDRGKRWVEQEGDVWVTDPQPKIRTIDIEVPVELSPATVQHKAQVKLATRRTQVGNYEVVHRSGATSQEEKEALLIRCDNLIAAVRAAREGANTTEINAIKVGAKVFHYLFETE